MSLSSLLRPLITFFDAVTSLSYSPPDEAERIAAELAGVRAERQFGRRLKCGTIFGEVAMNFRQYITRNAGICGGQAVMAGTRVLLKTVLESLAEGATLQEILDDFPSLREEHVKAAIAFAAVAAAEDLPVPDLPKVS